MKTLTILIISSLYSIMPSVVNSQDCGYCNGVLAKDLIYSASSFNQQLAILNILDQKSYEYLREQGSWDGGGDLLGIVSAGATSSWDNFKEKRDELFKKFQYNLTIQQSHEQLRIVTAPQAYEAWSACIKSCNEKDSKLARAYAYLSFADKEHIGIVVKYYVGADNTTAKETIGGNIDVINGSVIGQGQTKPTQSLKFKIKKGDAEQRFTIKRKNSSEKTIIVIRSKELAFQEFSAYKEPEPYQNATVKLLTTKSTDVTTLVGNETVKFRSRDLHECEYDDDDCCNFPEKVKGGKYCFQNIMLSLPVLTDRRTYGNYKIECGVDNDGSCGWSMSSGVFNARYLGTDKNKSVTFNSSSRSVEWHFKADVFDEVAVQAIEESVIPLTGNYFVVSVERDSGKTKVVSSVLKVSISGNETVFDVGKDSPNKAIKYLGSSQDNFNHSYYIENTKGKLENPVLFK